MRVDRIIREIRVIRGLNKLKVDSLELKVSFKIKVDSKICVFCEIIKTKRITNHDNKKCRIANLPQRFF